MKKLRTAAEQEVGKNIERIFTTCPDSVEVRLENFPKYVRRQHLKRFLALYEIFKLVLPVKGSIVECGVLHGFDTFAGFPAVSDQDANPLAIPQVGALYANSYEELQELIAEFDRDRFL